MRSLLHRRIELDLETEGVGELQRAALEWPLGSGASDVICRKERRRLVEILFVADLEPEAVASGRRCLTQHQRVVLMLLAASKVDGGVIGVFDVQTDGGLVEFSAEFQIRHIKDCVAGANDVERRIEDVLRNRHVGFPGVVIPVR